MTTLTVLGWLLLIALNTATLLILVRLNDRLTALLLHRTAAPIHASAAMQDDVDPVIAGPPQVRGDSVRDWLAHYTHGCYSWNDAVARFYERAAADPQIASYFHGVDLAVLQRHFTAAMVIVTSKGLTIKTADRMAQLHSGVRDRNGNPVTGEVYDKTVGILVSVLAGMGVPRSAVEDLGDVVALLRRAIVVEPESDGHNRPPGSDVS